jgi:hypothetical protein
MKKRGMPSPDEGDAVAICFSEPGGARPWSTTPISIGKSSIPGLVSLSHHVPRTSSESSSLAIV